MPNLRYLHIGVLVSLCLEAASPWQAWPVPPREIMADITNDLGICLLQVVGRESRENIAFSPYGVMSIVFLLYEGSHGNTAIEIYNSLRLPWDRHMSRIGFRDLHRHIKSYFSNDRFLRGLVLSKPSVPLKNEYVRLLNFYGFYPNRDGSSSTPALIPPGDSEGKGKPGDDMHTEAEPTYTPTKATTKKPTYVTTRPTTPTPTEEEYITQEFTRPYTSEYTTTEHPKVSTEYETKATTKVYYTKPTTQYPSTGYGGGTSYETDPTLPPYDPTKYPSKTTYMYTTKRKPMRTTTPLNTYEDTSTVKPGYNSHGMTQFFTPTTPGDLYPGPEEDHPTVEDNSIFGEDQQQNGHQQPTMRPTTDFGIYTPPKHGFTDPFTTEPYYTTNRRTTKKSTTTSFPDEDESPVVFPDQKRTTEYYEQTSTTPQSNNEGDDKIVYPTDSTTETDDSYTGIDIRLGNLKKTTPSVLENTQSINTQTERVNFKSRSNDEDITVKTEDTTKTESSPTTNDNSAESTTKPIQLVLEVETIKSITNNEKITQIMTRKEVEVANQMVDILNKTVLDTTATVAPSLATILMATELTTKIDQTEKPVTEEAINSFTEESTMKSSEIQQVQITTESVERTTVTENSPLTSSTVETTTLNQTETSTNNANTTATTEPTARRRKRSLIGPPIPYDHRDGPSNWIPAEGPHWEYNVPRDQWFFTYSGSEPVPVLTYMDYLPFAYIEAINTLALQLPLDDPRYSMLILLPMERYGLDQLLASLHQCSIREVLRDLRVIPVYAVLPAFTLVKHINLVPALTQMGIEEVFDPSRADLSGMASEPHLYVRSIEQLVTVSLRKYHYSTRRFDGRPEEIRHHFIANHPFVYFVLDTETNAALMSGTIVNPTAYKQTN